jgi:hypothetical protein
MKIVAIFFFLFILFTSCDKQKQSARQLAGTWELTSYKIKDSEGLSTYATGTGEIHFDACSDTPIKCTYQFNASLTFPGIPLTQVVEQGTYEMIEKGDYMTVKKADALGNELAGYTYRILVLTKTDLELEYPDNLGNYITMIFSR